MFTSLRAAVARDYLICLQLCRFASVMRRSWAGNGTTGWDGLCQITARAQMAGQADRNQKHSAGCIIHHKLNPVGTDTSIVNRSVRTISERRNKSSTAFGAAWLIFPSGPAMARRSNVAFAPRRDRSLSCRQAGYVTQFERSVGKRMREQGFI